MHCEARLCVQKEKVLKLRSAISKSKNEYAASLRRLEDISEEIHLKRSLEQKVSRLFHEINVSVMMSISVICS